jgi:hypothetical protein
MSDFQTSVQLTQPNGIPGQISHIIPFTGNALTVTSATASNVFGNAFTRTAGNETACGVGGTGEFAGILALSHAVAVGTVEGGTNFVLTNQTQGNFLTSGAIKVQVAGNCSIGDAVQFNQTNGNISTLTWGANVTAGSTLIRNAKVEYFNNTAGAGAIATIKIVGV